MPGCTKAVVVDRCTLDREMAEAAANAGAEIRLKTSVYGVEGIAFTQEEPVVTRRSRSGSSSPLMVPGARLPVSLVWSGRGYTFLVFRQTCPAIMIPGSWGYILMPPPSSSAGRSRPGEGRVRVGLCGTTDVPGKFKTFIKHFSSSAVQLVTGTLPLGLMPRTYGHRTLFAGDCAGLQNPRPEVGSIPVSGQPGMPLRLQPRRAKKTGSMTGYLPVTKDGGRRISEENWTSDFDFLPCARRCRRTRSMPSYGHSMILNSSLLWSRYGDMDRPAADCGNTPKKTGSSQMFRLGNFVWHSFAYSETISKKSL